MPPVRVRFAPSPTGHLHLGSALVALANRAFANREGGTLVLRIDDTDRQRSSADAVEGILDVLSWLGINYEDGPRFQRTRDDVYTEFLGKLLDEGLAYRCFCAEERLEEVRKAQAAAGRPPRYDGKCRDLSAEEVQRRLNLGEGAVVRLRVPEDEAYDIEDLVRGSVPAPAGSFGDFILQRSDGTFGYLFASVCDDLDLGITHVVRGEDHLSNTARQLAILDALDAPVPAFAHLPLLHGESGAKLAKRDHLGNVDELRRAGYLPRAVRRYLAELLGQGAVDLLEMGAAFDLTRVPSSSPKVDEARLASLGREELGALTDGDLERALGDAGFELRSRESALARELADGTPTVSALRESMARLRERPAPPDEPFDPQGLRVIAELCSRVESAGTGEQDWGEAHAGVLAGLREWGAGESLPTKAVLQPVRRALTGERSGPALEAVLCALGPAEVLERLKRPLGGLTSSVSG